MAAEALACPNASMENCKQVTGDEFFEACNASNLHDFLEQCGGIIQVLDCFDRDSAEKALQALNEVGQDEWKLSTNLAKQDAKHRFFRYEGRAVDHVLQPLLDVAPRMHPEVHAAKYESGGNICVHDDARSRAVEDFELERFKNSYPVGSMVHRKIAMIYYLTKDWKEEYGGCFVDYGLEPPRTVVPQFNSLIAFLVPRNHQVTMMSDNAPPRFSIFGWFSDDIPYANIQPQMMGEVQVQVTVPEGAKPGDVVDFMGPDGQAQKTQVPEGVEPGQTFDVTVRPPAQQYMVMCPPGHKEGDLVSFVGPEGMPLTAAVPAGARPGQLFPALVPLPQPFLTKVPEGKQPGDMFTFVDPHGVEQTAKVPKNVSVGQSITVWICPPLFVDLEVTVPDNIQAGEEFTIQSPGGKPLKVAVPQDKKGGDKIMVRTPMVV